MINAVLFSYAITPDTITFIFISVLLYVYYNNSSAGVKKLKATVCEFNALLRLSISEKGRKGIEQKTILTTKRSPLSFFSEDFCCVQIFS